MTTKYKSTQENEMKQLVLDEEMTNGLLQMLGEIPAKYSMQIIGTIKATFAEQNKEEEKGDDTTD